MIKINNVTKTYGESKGITNFNYDFEKGQVYGLIGPNGAGKTTLIKLITNFIFKQKGSIEKDFEKNEGLHNISYMPEFNMLVPGTVKQNIDFFSLTYDDLDKQVLDDILATFDIEPKMKVKDLSSGKSKAFRFALVASRKTKVYIFDEPFSGIDVITRKKIVTEIIQKLPIEESVVIISSHELHDMDQLLDVVLLLDKSHLIDDKPVETIKAGNQSLYDWFVESFS
jgi:ABC-2 type transport system ATP-binding protein